MSRGSRARRNGKKRHLHAVPSDRSRAASAPEPADDPFIESLRTALDSGVPLDLLSQVSAIVEATRPRLFPPPSADAPKLRDLVAALCGSPSDVTTAVLRVLRLFVLDGTLDARIARELGRRDYRLPDWIAALDDDEPFVTQVTRVVDAYGDVDEHVFSVRLPDGDQLTAVVMIDHNEGSAVTEGFVVPMGHREILERVTELQVDDEPRRRFDVIDAADMRILLEAAIDMGRHLLPEPETDTWPMLRPLVEWMVRLLPDGGKPPIEEDWNEAACAGLAASFYDSEHSVGLDRPGHRDMLDALMWLNNADPMRWSPRVIEAIMLDIFPRKIIDDPQTLALMPAVLRGFVRFCGFNYGLSEPDIDGNLDVIDELEQAYLAAIGGESPAGFEFDQLGVAFMMSTLLGAVGGSENLLSLNDIDLPDEDLDLSDVPADLHEVVTAISRRCDECAAALFDVEHRTAMRRFVARSAAGAPDVFRRKASVDRSAATVAWVIGTANHSVGAHRNTTVKNLLAWFGVSGSVTARAEQMLRGIGVDLHDSLPGQTAVGDPELLVGARRREIIVERDRLAPAD